MNSIQKIESAVYAIRPELKELSFGCRVSEYPTMHENWTYYYIKDRDETEQSKYLNYQVIEERKLCEENGETSVYAHMVSISLPKGKKLYNFGHKITLQDILLAMGEDFAIGANGYFLVYIGEGQWRHTENDDRYNLRLSPYEQSEETLNFIAENLTK